MAETYEAIVQTDDGGTMRAFQVSPGTICITEDGVDGIIEHIELPPSYQRIEEPSQLMPTLIAYVFEMKRGLNITSAKLRRRGDR